MVEKFKHLSEEEVKDGKKFADVFSKLTKSEKAQVKIYAQALIDRSEIEKIEDREAAAG